MLANRSRDTKPEVALRRLLHARGLRYRVAFRPLPDRRRSVDIAFTRVRVAVMIDGCFWHGCLEHYRPPVRNASYWSQKVRRNVARDEETTGRLIAAGWQVLRFWEHEDPHTVADVVERTIRGTKALTRT